MNRARRGQRAQPRVNWEACSRSFYNGGEQSNRSPRNNRLAGATEAFWRRERANKKLKGDTKPLALRLCWTRVVACCREITESPATIPFFLALVAVRIVTGEPRKRGLFKRSTIYSRSKTSSREARLGGGKKRRSFQPLLSLSDGLLFTVAGIFN